MTLPHLDIDTWEMADGRLAGEIADAGQIGPFERFVVGSLPVNRPDLVFRLEAPAVPHEHRGLKWALSLGVVYDTDVAEVGGRQVGGDGTYYVPRDSPTLAVLVTSLVRFDYLENRPPITGQLPGGLISVSGP